MFQEALCYVPRHGIEPEGDEVTLKSLAGDTFVMVPDRCGLARRTRELFASARVSLKVYAGEALGYHVMQEWAALDLGSAILPQSQLAERTRALPIMHGPGNPVTITYRVAPRVRAREAARGAAATVPPAPLGALVEQCADRR